MKFLISSRPQFSIEVESGMVRASSFTILRYLSLVFSGEMKSTLALKVSEILISMMTVVEKFMCIFGRRSHPTILLMRLDFPVALDP